MKTRHACSSAALAVLLAAPWPAAAAAAEAPLDLPLEQLMQIGVETASRKAERLQDVAAAVFVITRDDIERSGATSIPEALRLAPGIEVARLSNSRWAVSARGFNGRFANKLLVLMDGRSIYSPLFSGVVWEAEDTLLADIERIEVIRGPGASLWGSNAVNGVINIITRRARDTQGTLAVVGGGSEERVFGAIRHGFAAGDGNARLWAKTYERGASETTDGADGRDSGHAFRIGGRGDWSLAGGGRVTVSGMAYRAPVDDRWLLPDIGSPTGAASTDLRQQNEGAHVLARHEWLFNDGSEAALQAFVDLSRIRVAGQLDQRRRTIDIDFQHRLRLIERHDIVWGLGWRQSQDRIDSGGIIDIQPRNWRFWLASAFFQDEISIVPDALKAIVGARFEYNNLTRFEPQPTARIAWTPTPRATLWAAYSRAVRTPSRAENDANLDLVVMPANPPIPPVLLTNRPSANRGLESERVDSLEMGWRQQVNDDASIDATVFRGRYHRLRTVTAGASFLAIDPIPHFVQEIVPATSGRATVDGIEVAADWRVARPLRLQASYSYLRMRTQPESGDLYEDGALAALEGAVARHRLSLRSSIDVDARTRLDLWLRHVSALPGAPDTPSVDRFTTLDARIAWRPAPAVEIAVVGQNLLHAKHVEYIPDYLRSQTLVVRPSVYAKLKWAF